MATRKPTVKIYNEGESLEDIPLDDSEAQRNKAQSFLTRCRVLIWVTLGFVFALAVGALIWYFVTDRFGVVSYWISPRNVQHFDYQHSFRMPRALQENKQSSLLGRVSADGSTLAMYDRSNPEEPVMRILRQGASPDHLHSDSEYKKSVACVALSGDGHQVVLLYSGAEPKLRRWHFDNKKQRFEPKGGFDVLKQGWQRKFDAGIDARISRDGCHLYILGSGGQLILEHQRLDVDPCEQLYPPRHDSTQPIAKYLVVSDTGDCEVEIDANEEKISIRFASQDQTFTYMEYKKGQPPADKGQPPAGLIHVNENLWLLAWFTGPGAQNMQLTLELIDTSSGNWTKWGQETHMISGVDRISDLVMCKVNQVQKDSNLVEVLIGLTVREENSVERRVVALEIPSSLNALSPGQALFTEKKPFDGMNDVTVLDSDHILIASPQKRLQHVYKRHVDQKKTPSK